MPAAPVPEVGTEFKRFRFQGLAGRRRVSGHWVTLWRLVCACGTVRVVPAIAVRAGRAGSCGCLRRDKIAKRWHELRDLVCKDCGKRKPRSAPIYLGKRCHDCHKAWRKLDYKVNVNNIRSKQRLSSEKNSDKIVERVNRWRAANPDKALFHAKKMKHLRRTKMRSSASDVTLDAWRARLEEFGHACAYCLRTDVLLLTQDHVLAVSRGGLHLIENIVPACQSCNARKHNRGILCMVNPPKRAQRVVS
jgi:5-methylcytosine-specific restriction endonuclease McrA